MKILVVGGGAREHALVWKLRQSSRVSEMFCVPGNAGIASLARTGPIAADDVAGIRHFAEENATDLTVVGPEAALAAGVVDEFKTAGLTIFGPTRAAARIESSKLWAKELIQRAGVPIPRWAAAETPGAALSLIGAFGLPVVLKADGLAAGKGTVVCHSRQEAEATIEEFMIRRIYGAAGERLEIEEFLRGPELSAFALVDGTHVLPLLGARDHKPLGDGNAGPNTGGMGGYARPSDATPELMEEIRERVFLPTVRAMAAEGCPFVGVLYAGLILTQEGPKVIEFNCRWGDPEAQLLVPLLETDLVDLMFGCIEGRLDRLSVDWSAQTTVGVVLASAGYPEAPRKGDRIRGLDALEDNALVFHAATRLVTQEPASTEGVPTLVTDGGRVLTVVGVGDTLAEASLRAYRNVDRIHFEGKQYRRDLATDNDGAVALARRDP